nr:MAG: ORF3 [Torque teno polar bear virus 17]
MKTLAKLETRTLHSPVKTDSQYKLKTLAWQKRSQCTPGISSSRGSTPNSPSKDSYRTFILNSLQRTAGMDHRAPERWSSPKASEERPRNSEESKARARPPKAAALQTTVPGQTPPPLRRAKRRKLRHFRDRRCESSESDSTDLGSWSDSDSESDESW